MVKSNEDFNITEYYNFNSLELVKFILDLEEVFNISIDDEYLDFKSISHISYLVDIIKNSMDHL